MSDFNVNTFTSKLKGGGARTNLMWCTMTNNTYGGLKKWQYMCKASQIPASTITAIEVPYFGRMVKVAGESREFGPLTTTVVQDEGYEIYGGMVAWLEDLNGAATNTTKTNLFSSRSSYTADITLEMYKKDGTSDQKWKFINCWPSNMSAIDLNWDTVNTIQEFTIDWQYDYYLHDQANIKKDT
jgi:hypothetical protein